MPDHDVSSEPVELRRIADFVRAHPGASRHVVDLPYQLASHAAQDPENRRLCPDHDGRIRAYALAQTPMWTLDFAIAPGLEGSALEREVLAWDVERWRAIAASGGPGMLFVDVAEHDGERQALLTALGFARHEWY
jgi:hypothetical protein